MVRFFMDINNPIIIFMEKVDRSCKGLTLNGEIVHYFSDFIEIRFLGHFEEIMLETFL